MIVSFAIVACNEEQFLPGLLEDLKRQDYPHEKMEILLIDSMSTDKTWEIMLDFEKKNRDFARVLALKNHGKNIPRGHNLALDHYRGDALIRVDAHASVPHDFVSKHVAVLEGGEMVCGGRRPNIIRGDSPWKKTLLAAEMSVFGSGGAQYRRGSISCYAKSLFCGMYRREVYERVGRYDVRLDRTEDNDMAWRVRKAGYRLCFCPDIVFYQYARPTLRGMLRQKFQNGCGIGKTLWINRYCVSLFHLVPFGFVVSALVAALAVCAGLIWPLGALWGTYGVAALAFALPEFWKRPFYPGKLLLPVLFALLHVSYGLGTLVGLTLRRGRVEDG